MLKSWLLVVLAVVVTCGIGAIASVDRNYRPTAPIDQSQRPLRLAKPINGFRKAERGRRAVRPVGDPKRENGLSYDEVLKRLEGSKLLPKPAEPMPPTYCRSIECAPKYTGGTTDPYDVHRSTVHFFESRSGFGSWRMFGFENDRGVVVASRDIDRVELVSLLTDDEPSVYVLDEMATPTLARQAKRRPLDEFEHLGLDAVRRGEELVWTREAPTRMFGAIRAKADCLYCHAKAKEGDLLGAFTYYLDFPVDQVNMREQVDNP